MTLLLSGRRLPTSRPPFSLSCVSGLSSDRHRRVPPTGIPRPDQEEVPAGSARPLRRAAGVALVAFAMMAGQGSAGASADTGISWQFGQGVGIRAVLGGAGAGADRLSAKPGPATSQQQKMPMRMPTRMPMPMPGHDWGTRPVHASKDSGQDSAQDDAQDNAQDRVQAGHLVPSNPAMPENAAGADLANADNATAPDQREVREDLAPTLDEQRTVVTRVPTVLPDRLRQAVLLDPRVAEMSARACQMAHRLGLPAPRAARSCASRGRWRRRRRRWSRRRSRWSPLVPMRWHHVCPCFARISPRWNVDPEKEAEQRFVKAALVAEEIDILAPLVERAEPRAG